MFNRSEVGEGMFLMHVSEIGVICTLSNDQRQISEPGDAQQLKSLLNKHEFKSLALPKNSGAVGGV